MSDGLRFLILALAVWRFTSLIGSERGPFDLLAKFRHLVGVRRDVPYSTYGSTVVPANYGTNPFSRMIVCPWCSSIWYAIIFFAIVSILPDAIYLLAPFAISAAAILTEEIMSVLTRET